MSDIFLEFINYLRLEKKYSNHTIISYETDIRQWREFLNFQYSITDILQVNASFVRSWIVQLLDQQNDEKTVKRKLSCLKSFYKFAMIKGLINSNPLSKIIAPKTKKKLPEFISEKDIDNILLDIHFEDNWKGKRDKLLLEMLYATGVRRSEIRNVKYDDIDKYQSQIKVLGKGNKERIIPLSPHIINCIDEYWNNVPFSNLTFLFCNDRGLVCNEKWVYLKVKYYLQSHTTLVKKSPHIMRHTFATHLLNQGADINAIKDLLGHSSLSATQVYTHQNMKKLKESHKKAHPRG